VPTGVTALGPDRAGLPRQRKPPHARRRVAATENRASDGALAT
jgi:hypothetical protein